MMSESLVKASWKLFKELSPCNIMNLKSLDPICERWKLFCKILFFYTRGHPSTLIIIRCSKQQHLLVKQTIVTCTTKYSSSPLELLLPPPTRPVVSAPTSLRLYLYVYTSRPSRPNVFVPPSIHLSLFVLKRIGETLYHFPFDFFSSQPHLRFFFLIFFAYSRKKHYLCGGFG